MEMVFITALGVGGATVIGAVLGFVFKKISHKFSDTVLTFAAGVMLCAAITGLILPSLDHGGKMPLLVTVEFRHLNTTIKVSATYLHNFCKRTLDTIKN